MHVDVRPKSVTYSVLLILTFALIAWQHFGMNTELSVPVFDESRVKVFNDKINGGRSVGQISFLEDATNLSCQIVLSHTFAFCGVWFALDDNGEGVDLSAFDTLTIEIDFQSNTRDTILMYLLNKEVHNKFSIVRSNQLTLVPEQGRRVYQLDLGNLFVPSWWIFQQPLEVPSATQIDRVQTFQISTGDSTQVRNLDIKIHSATFSGEWISKAELYFGLLAFWCINGIVQLMILTYRYYKMYLKSRGQAKDLNAINKFLEIERDKMADLAKNDPLTGCLNRNGLSDVLESIVQRYKTGETETSLILFDIDHFKKINDEFGHGEGDRVLVNLTQLIRLHIRDTDHLIRWGGEEFAIICSYTTTLGAKRLAENLCKRIAEATLSEQAKITASFGVANMQTTKIEAWFKRADSALYKAKANGRNQVVQAA